ncbi:hypothetical protein RvY_01335-3 [Ramazzottius varieornatus]|uniref:Uncharacterized protein n=1 Tax=Ramazzottius varieornatus TaxID=947166 RepID=A0A1D1UJX4_RAMVA|nr:hypothetical protein RvY_01335-3 [Ramazzottius varieornatus]
MCGSIFFPPIGFPLISKTWKDYLKYRKLLEEEASTQVGDAIVGNGAAMRRTSTSLSIDCKANAAGMDSPPWSHRTRFRLLLSRSQIHTDGHAAEANSKRPKYTMNQYQMEWRNMPPDDGNVNVRLTCRWSVVRRYQVLLLCKTPVQTNLQRRSFIFHMAQQKPNFILFRQ